MMQSGGGGNSKSSELENQPLTPTATPPPNDILNL